MKLKNYGHKTKRTNMKKFFIAFCFLSITILPQQRQLTLDDIFLSDKFTPENVENIRWKPDGSAFAFTRKNPENSLNDIYLFDLNTLEEELFLPAEKIIFNDKKLEISSYEWTDDGKCLLIRGPEKRIWRHSRMSSAYLLNLRTNEMISLADEYPGLKNVKLSPDGNFAGYVKDHNLFLVELSTGLLMEMITYLMVNLIGFMKKNLQFRMDGNGLKTEKKLLSGNLIKPE